MSTLFAKKRKLSSGRKRSLPQSSADTSSNLPADGVTGKSGDIRGPATTGTASEGCEGDVSNSSRQGAQRNPQAIREMEVQGFDSPAGDGAMRGEGCGAGTTFESLGLCEWLLTACKAMGFRRPTPVQAHCIPAILKGKDVLGCAETGSGKTAAFALPILHELSKDPYGVFAIVLTPTRELALQISEQFDALGAPMGLRHAVVIGGVGLLEQSVQLAGRPHVIVATPGRLRDHLQGQDAPALRKCRYLVLDEADRLMAQTFQSELKCITAALPGSRQTLLFSATMTSNLEALQSLALTDPVKYDLTKKATVPATLTQEYLFMPQQMKTCFVVQTLRMLASDNLWIDSDDDEGMGWKGRGKRDREDSGIGGHEDEDAQEAGRARSVMIFVSKCRRCHELAETLLELGVDCTPLHSLLGQRRRIAALGKFKSQQTRVLVSTDVASRGLDIPVVDLVINFDVPRVATDYVHRVGRTARAGRRGRAVSLVSQYDINLVHNIEKYTGVSLQLCSEVVEEDVLNLLNRVAKASKVAKMRLMDQGFDERESAVKERNNRQKAAKLGVGQEITGSRGGPQAAVKRATAGGSEKTKPRRGPSASKARKGLKKVG